MGLSPRTRRLAGGLALLVGVNACSGGSGAGDGAEWRQIGEIDHLVAEDLPEGWVVSTATLRPGRPTSAWTYRSDVFVDADRSTVVIVTASEFVPPGEHEPRPGSAPGDPEDVAVEDLWHLFAYAGVAPPEGAAARQTGWRSGWISFTVVRVAGAPEDDALLEAATAELAEVDDLDFDHPEALGDAGFTLLSTITDTEDVPDYTITWAHRDDAGRTREQAREAPEGSPRLWVNVGSRMYVPMLAAQGELPDDLQEAEVREDDGSLELRFLREGLPVTIGGSGVDPDALRALARSLHEVSDEEWRTTLGDRLLVDEPEER